MRRTRKLLLAALLGSVAPSTGHANLFGAKLGDAASIFGATTLDFKCPDVLAWIVPSTLYCKLCRTATLNGPISDCRCNFETVDVATHDYFHPLLTELQKTSFFRFFKVGFLVILATDFSLYSQRFLTLATPLRADVFSCSLLPGLSCRAGRPPRRRRRCTSTTNARFGTTQARCAR